MNEQSNQFRAFHTFVLRISPPVTAYTRSPVPGPLQTDFRPLTIEGAGMNVDFRPGIITNCKAFKKPSMP